VFTLLIVLKLIVDKKSASNVIAWLLAILFIPYVAIPFFIIFQRKDKSSFWQKNEMSIRRPSLEKSCEEYYNYKNLPKNLLNVFLNLKYLLLQLKIQWTYTQMA
jgi:cardiolipin synthase